jgi:hypothetical protein
MRFSTYFHSCSRFHPKWTAVGEGSSPEFSGQPNEFGLVAVGNNGWGQTFLFYRSEVRGGAAAFYRELIVGSGFRESDAGCGAIPRPSKSTAARFSFARN